MPLPSYSSLINSYKFKLSFIRAHRKLVRVRRLLHAAFDTDPWAMLTLLGAKHITPIKHEPNRSTPITVNLAADFVQDGENTWKSVVQPTTAYVVWGNPRPTINRPREDYVGEPLGPEDYELGLKVPPAESNPSMEEFWPTSPDVSAAFSTPRMKAPPLERA